MIPANAKLISLSWGANLVMLNYYIILHNKLFPSVALKK